MIRSYLIRNFISPLNSHCIRILFCTSYTNSEFLFDLLAFTTAGLNKNDEEPPDPYDISKQFASNKSIIESKVPSMVGYLNYIVIEESIILMNSIKIKQR